MSVSSLEVNAGFVSLYMLDFPGLGLGCFWFWRWLCVWDGGCWQSWCIRQGLWIFPATYLHQILVLTGFRYSTLRQRPVSQWGYPVAIVLNTHAAWFAIPGRIGTHQCLFFWLPLDIVSIFRFRFPVSAHIVLCIQWCHMPACFLSLSHFMLREGGIGSQHACVWVTSVTSSYTFNQSPENSETINMITHH